MTRATEAATAGAIALVIYIAAWIGVIPLPQTFYEQILPVLPWWSLVSFGAYSLGSIGYHLMTFEDCPGAYQELMGQIQEAKIELSAKGVPIS
ncbi:hypothetical protein BZG36_01862 [Bifiguratus adelaidae]|uniref:Dolichol-phosphate mannosyltransferase subunit 3 n=1 Tax=Bifiguratus adelaidae TaxID=1938954 RepID=A0A261Y2B2_9FUNG|nr:hypothetical protein BZG36_01862 [Bifiguratus adelaidae]